MTQFYKLTLEAAITHYRNGDITAKGLLRFWLRIQLAEGWSINVNPTQLRKLLGMKPSTFWAALSKLKEGGEIAWEEPTSMKITRLKPETENSFIRESSQIIDACLETEMVVPESEPASQIVEEKGLESSESNASSSLSDSYQSFIKSLSQMEREKFLAFCKRKARELPKKVVLFDAWMSKHFPELWTMWQEVERESASRSEEPQLHPALVSGLNDGTIKKIDPYFQGLWDALGNWWKQADWLAAHGG